MSLSFDHHYQSAVDQLIEKTRDRLGIPQTIDLSAGDTIVDVFARTVERHADRPAFTSLGETITYRELDELSGAFASYLQHHTNLEPGDRLAIQLPNLIQYPVVLFGALRAGLVVVNTNPLYTEWEMQHQFKDAGVKALVILENFAAQAAEVLPHTEIETVIVTGVADLHPALKRTLIHGVLRYVKRQVPDYDIADAISLRDVLSARCHALQPVHMTEDDVAILQYTGGTTGVAKGAMLTHRNLVANMHQSLWLLQKEGHENKREVLISPLPLYHIYAFTINCMVGLSGGEHSVLIPNPRDLKGFVKELRKWPFTVFLGLNTLFVALTKCKAFKEISFSHLWLTLSGGMALTRHAATTWEEATGCPVTEGYGLTETSPVVSCNPPWGQQLGSIGVPLPSTRVKVVDAEGRDCQPGEVGELCVQGPQVMKGYWQRPDATEQVLSEDGWLRTGDMAKLLPDGYIKLVDRKKDMIVVSGFNVYPNELEDVITGHPHVVEAAAVGVPDERSGEVIKLFVVRSDEGLDEAAVKAYMREYLTGYKIPKQVEFREELPKTNVGKVLRRELRDTPAGSN